MPHGNNDQQIVSKKFATRYFYNSTWQKHNGTKYTDKQPSRNVIEHGNQNKGHNVYREQSRTDTNKTGNRVNIEQGVQYAVNVVNRFATLLNDNKNGYKSQVLESKQRNVVSKLCIEKQGK